MQLEKQKETQKEAEKKKQEIELNEKISEKEREDLLMEVRLTQEALREMKRQQRVSISNESSQQPLMTIRNKSRKHSSSPLSLSMSESSCKSEDKNWTGVKSLNFMMKGEKVKVEVKLYYISWKKYPLFISTLSNIPIRNPMEMTPSTIMVPIM